MAILLNHFAVRRVCFALVTQVAPVAIDIEALRVS